MSEGETSHPSHRELVSGGGGQAPRQRLGQWLSLWVRGFSFLLAALALAHQEP